MFAPQTSFEASMTGCRASLAILIVLGIATTITGAYAGAQSDPGADAQSDSGRLPLRLRLQQEAIEANSHRTGENARNSEAKSFAGAPMPGGGGPFSTAQLCEIGINPMQIVSADLDGDGSLDLAGSSLYDESSLVVLKNRGDGTFGPSDRYLVGSPLYGLGVADYDSDGSPDLVAPGGGTRASDLLLMHNRGDGTFNPPVSLPLEIDVWQLAVADLNGDGHSDLLGNSVEADSIVVLLGTGAGAFASRTTYPSPFAFLRYGRPYGIADFDGDGHPDLMVAGAESVAVLLARDGALAPPVISAIRAGIAAADFNHDGRADLVNAAPLVQLRYGRGDGTFDPPIESPAETYAWVAAVADLNGDDVLDLAVPSGDFLTVLRGRANGTFLPDAPYGIGPTSIPVVVGDFDRDGWPDVAVGSRDDNDVAVLRNKGDGKLACRTVYPSGEYGRFPDAITAADFDGDGLEDMGVLNHYGNTLTVLFGVANGALRYDREYRPIPTYPVTIIASDLTGDGRPDLTISGDDWGDSGTQTVRNSGDGTFSLLEYEYYNEAEDLAAADFDHDGYQDLVLAGSSLRLMRGHGDGTLASPVPITGEEAWYGVESNDFNQDGWPDLAAISYSDRLSVFLNDGSAHFLPPISYSVSKPIDVVVNRFGADANVDIAVLSWDSSIISVLTGNGDGTFESFGEYAVGGVQSGPMDIEAGDVDRDGWPDLLVANGPIQRNENRGTVTLWRGRADGLFDRRSDFDAGYWPNALALGDVNGDGVPELAVCQGSPRSLSGISLFLNETPDPVTTVLVSLVSAEAFPGRMRVVWSTHGLSRSSPIVERARGDAGWIELKRLAADGEGRFVCEDSAVQPGTRYGYRLRYGTGIEEIAGETWLESRPAPGLSLHAPRPNPVGPEGLRIAFALPNASPATLDLLDVAGRVVRSERITALGPGDHVVELGPGSSLPAGVYLIRLMQGHERRFQKTAILH